MNIRRFNNPDDPEYQERINSFKAAHGLRGLNELKVTLSLIQAASAFALEGINRATASQVTQRAMKEYEIEATPSFTGQVFASLGISSVISHGKSRLVLEHDQLESIRKKIEAQWQEGAEKLNSALETFNQLPERIKELEARYQEMRKDRQKEQELIVSINEERRKPSRLPELKEEYKRLLEQNKLVFCLILLVAKVHSEVISQELLNTYGLIEIRVIWK